MSFCSYEEAWGSPFEADSKNEHVEKENDVPLISKDNISTHVEKSDNTPGLVEKAPLTGSLLGGAIPKEQWKTNEISNSHIPSFEEKFDKKIDQLINTIEKYTTGYNNNSESNTNWTDIIIFILLGIFAILILDMFFRFGKHIIESKIQNSMTYDSPQVHHMHQQFEQNTSIPQIPKYHYKMMGGRTPNYPYSKISDLYKN